MSKNHILEIENLSLQINDLLILQNINLTVQERDFILLIGKNGSGKSSLLKLINGTYSATTGTIKFVGKTKKDLDKRFLAQNIVSLNQDINQIIISELSIIENFMLWKFRHSKPTLSSISQKEYMECTKALQQFTPDLCQKLDDPARVLSGGQKQIFALALCLLYPPKLLILDEHTSALDPKTAEFVAEFTNDQIKKHGITCIMTTHNTNHLERYGNKTIEMVDGKIR